MKSESTPITCLRFSYNGSLETSVYSGLTAPFGRSPFPRDFHRSIRFSVALHFIKLSGSALTARQICAASSALRVAAAPSSGRPLPAFVAATSKARWQIRKAMRKRLSRSMPLPGNATTALAVRYISSSISINWNAGQPQFASKKARERSTNLFQVVSLSRMD